MTSKTVKWILIFLTGLVIVSLLVWPLLKKVKADDERLTFIMEAIYKEPPERIPEFEEFRKEFDFQLKRINEHNCPAAVCRGEKIRLLVEAEISEN